MNNWTNQEQVTETRWRETRQSRKNGHMQDECWKEGGVEWRTLVTEWYFLV